MLYSFTEITKTNDEKNPTKESECLINPEGIVNVNTTEIQGAGPHIIGLSKTTPVSFISLTNGRGVYVKESVQEVKAIVNATV